MKIEIRRENSGLFNLVSSDTLYAVLTAQELEDLIVSAHIVAPKIYYDAALISIATISDRLKRDMQEGMNNGMQ